MSVSAAAMVEELMSCVDTALMEGRPGYLRMWRSRIQSAAEALVGIAVAPDVGPWEISNDGRRISSDNFDHDVTLVVQGDFYSDEARRAYAFDVAMRLLQKRSRAAEESPTFTGGE